MAEGCGRLSEKVIKESDCQTPPKTPHQRIQLRKERLTLAPPLSKGFSFFKVLQLLWVPSRRFHSSIVSISCEHKFGSDICTRFIPKSSFNLLNTSAAAAVMVDVCQIELRVFDSSVHIYVSLWWTLFSSSSFMTQQRCKKNKNIYNLDVVTVSVNGCSMSGFEWMLWSRRGRAESMKPGRSDIRFMGGLKVEDLIQILP